MTKIQRFLVEGQQEPVSHYCHAVRHGDRIWISGMVGIDESGIVPEDTVEQFAIAMENFDSALRAAGGGAQNVVKVTVFVTDISDRSRINPIRQEYFGENRPASSLFEVSNLVLPELKVEIEGEAVIFD